MGGYVGRVNFIAFYLWLLSVRISSFGGIWSYYIMVFVQWFFVGFILSFLIRPRKIGHR